MTGDIDIVALRQLVGRVLEGLPDFYSRRDMEEDVWPRLGLPRLPEEGSKRESARASLAMLPDVGLPAVAERILRYERVDAATRNAIEDMLWAGRAHPEIPKRIRRDLARALDLEDLVHGAGRLRDLLERLWVLDDDPLAGWTGAARGLGARIDQHVFHNPGDWDTGDLFEQLGAFESGHPRFARFLEGLVSPDVVPDEPAQRRLVDTANQHLRAAGVELRETGNDGGYPVFQIVAAGLAPARRPKNLIFASLAKPDIRLCGAVDNDIEIVENADKVLVYDRPISADGIRWRDLQAWWRETCQLPSDAEAKASLFARLQQSLPNNSPPQRNLYRLYHEIHGTNVPNLPALLPEVWLHWDPQTKHARGRRALPRHRMDFLLLLPYGQRVVLEVDGAQHYSTPDGRPNSTQYAATMRADRDLKLNGYEVFHFGASELISQARARPMLQQFFTDLFRRFEVDPGTS